MAASDSPALRAIASQFASALDAYEFEVDALLGTHFEPELYRHVSNRMEEMRRYAAALPPLSAAWVELLIRHAELMHGLWRAQRDDTIDLARLQGQVHAAARALSARCLRLLPPA